MNQIEGGGNCVNDWRFIFRGNAARKLTVFDVWSGAMNILERQMRGNNWRAAFRSQPE